MDVVFLLLAVGLLAGGILKFRMGWRQDPPVAYPREVDFFMALVMMFLGILFLIIAIFYS